MASSPVDEAGSPLRPLPRILVTVQAPDRRPDPGVETHKNGLYLESVRRAGGEPMALDEHASEDQRATAFATMDGLLLSGGADLDPALYGAPNTASVAIEPGRDALEKAAWGEARRRRLPVLGICRGFQAINVFSGGRLRQEVRGHRGASYPSPDVRRHPLRLRPASRLARILRPTDPTSAVLAVNSYHHQGVGLDDVAPGLLTAATSPSPDGELVEALETADDLGFVIGIQCHPERRASSPPEFERLWAVFVDAARRASLDAAGSGAAIRHPR
jgi:putative glutamine amidotransferase